MRRLSQKENRVGSNPTLGTRFFPLSSNGRTLKKGYPDRDTVSNSKFHSKEVIVVRIHATGPV